MCQKIAVFFRVASELIPEALAPPSTVDPQVDTNRLRADLSLVLLLCGIGPFPAVIKCSLEAALRCLVLWYGAQPAGDRHIVHFSEPQGMLCGSCSLQVTVCSHLGPFAIGGEVK